MFYIFLGTFNIPTLETGWKPAHVMQIPSRHHIKKQQSLCMVKMNQSPHQIIKKRYLISLGRITFMCSPPSYLSPYPEFWVLLISHLDLWSEEMTQQQPWIQTPLQT